jgi:delta 1-pyrroline-5-carboxylate dehydrogenase
VIPSDSPDENLVLHREPIGVVACLIPFNYPVDTFMRKIAPALIAGNTVVVRPSNNTPTSAFEIVDLPEYHVGQHQRADDDGRKKGASMFLDEAQAATGAQAPQSVKAFAAAH